MRQSLALCMLLLLSAGSAWAADTSPVEEARIALRVEGIAANDRIEPAFALCTPTADGKSEKVTKQRPLSMQWSGVPRQVHSLAVFVIDPDVPSVFDDAGKEGKVLPADMKRQDFFHYGMVNIYPEANGLESGRGASFVPADGVVDAAHAPSGKELVNDLGLNAYVDPKHAYGGPCPPFNDARMHHYHYIVLALAKDTPVEGVTPTTCKEPACDANTAKNTYERLRASGKVIAEGSVVGTYTLNPKLLKQ